MGKQRDIGKEFFVIGEDGNVIDSTPGLSQYMEDNENTEDIDEENKIDEEDKTADEENKIDEEDKTAGETSENDESTYNRFSQEDAKMEDQKAENKAKVNNKNKKTIKTFSKKAAIKYSCSTHVEGYCPYCHTLSMSKSNRLGDKFWIGLASYILKSKYSTFYCFNPNCKQNYRSGWCVRCAGEKYIGKAFPMKRILNIN